MASSKPTDHAAVRASGASRPGRWYSWAEAAMFAGLLNVLIVVFTAAGGVLFGWAPALAAATAVARRRLRGSTFPIIRTFARTWRHGFAHANLLLAPPALGLALLGTSLVALRDRPAPAALVVGLWVAAGLCAAHLLLTVAMDAHYDLRRGRCLRLAWAFMFRFPGAPLLLAATTVLAVAITLFIPGLLPVLSIGAWISVCTALSMSFFAANERALHGGDTPAATIDPTTSK